ncbi:universal stress protein [Actinoplanes sp. NPDC049265]|uniref:universal stress protein n=1 Tax=Actinoplanes sp. NPDC049265 TaxID=3363902 RepID=UPI00371294F0
MTNLSSDHKTRYNEALYRYLATAGQRPEKPGPRPPAAKAATVTKTGLVVVGVDDSPASGTAVDHAAIEAELRGWNLRIVHAQPAAGAAGEARNAGADLLQRLTDRVHAASATVAVTRSSAAAAVVAGRHGPRHLPEVLLGSVSRSLVQRAHCPVFLVG